MLCSVYKYSNKSLLSCMFFKETLNGYIKFENLLMLCSYVNKRNLVTFLYKFSFLKCFNIFIY